MNLPTYSLSDSPVSSIINLSIGIIGPAQSSILSNNNQQQQSSSSSSSRDLFERKLDHPTASSIKPLGTSPSTCYRLQSDRWQDVENRRPLPNPPGQTSTASAIASSSTSTPAATTSTGRTDPISPRRKPKTRTGWDEIFCSANLEGWAVYGTYPLRMIDKQFIPNGSLKIAVSLHRSNIMFLVGGPPSPLYSPNKVIIYDSSVCKPIYSIEFSSSVLGLTARSDKLIVVLINRVIIQEQASWETCDNQRGLVCLASDYGSSLLIFPGRQLGQVQVVHLSPLKETHSKRHDHDYQNSTTRTQSNYRSTSILIAHTTSLASMAITPSGNLIATASVTGTLIRIWDSKTSSLIKELRRGAICASSDKGTIHMWNLNQKSISNKKNSKDSSRPVSLALIKPYLPKYFQSTWSDAFFRLPPPAPPSGRSISNLLSSLPIHPVSGVSSGSSSSSQPNESLKSFSNQSKLAEGISSKSPTTEDDVSLVNWILTDDYEAQIVVITRSGNWYRLRIPTGPTDDDCGNFVTTHENYQQQQQVASCSNSNSNMLGIIRQDKKSLELECVEFLRFGEDEDWSEDE
ncbi:hypothetical protein PPACK8108_LOCUS20795 [Phakopsora pachyrhizi]|uniref:WD40 repeat-like protein n=1 Tax=Phakopsora pachyrhizi TaxID=170000 RepID=A0AAV0BKU5_PHAPC|nr:hypothetical protein PPACK8108_LOCUS20795 [Phakopsora pachyrhizi]